jgi:hypothetical protein
VECRPGNRIEKRGLNMQTNIAWIYQDDWYSDSQFRNPASVSLFDNHQLSMQKSEYPPCENDLPEAW